jgi:hypothetical protein
MRARPFVVSVAAALAAVFVIPSFAIAGPWLPAPGEYFSQFTAGRYSADTYYNNDGDRASFKGMTERRWLTSYSELGWKKSASFIFSVPVISVTNRAGRDFGFPSATQTGLGDLTVGIHYRLKDGPTAASIEADWVAPLGYQHDAAPSLGTGQHSLGGALHLGARLPALDGFFELSGGGRSKLEKIESRPSSNTFSSLFQPILPFESEIYGSATAAAWIGNSVLVSAGYFLQNAPAGVSVENHSYVFNPQVMYRVDERLDVFAGSRHTSAGKNVLHTDEIYVGMAFKKTRLNRLQGFLGGTKRP